MLGTFHGPLGVGKGIDSALILHDHGFLSLYGNLDKNACQESRKGLNNVCSSMLCPDAGVFPDKSVFHFRYRMLSLLLLISCAPLPSAEPLRW